MAFRNSAGREYVPLKVGDLSGLLVAFYVAGLVTGGAAIYFLDHFLH